jgi:phosphatidylinositol alpha-mannosyltransferase
VANVATFHAKLPETLMSRTVARVVTPYTKPLLKFIDEFTAVSDAAAEYVRSLSEVPIDIIPNGINLKVFLYPDRPVKANDKTILYVGRLERRKGVKYLLEAFQLLQAEQPDAKLLIAGDGPDRQKLEEHAKSLSLQNVSFLGFVDEQKKIDLLRSADLFCSPALYGESFGIVLLEAMASSLVTVAGDNPGYTSVMRGVGQLSLVNPKDAIEFARRLELLLFTEELRELWINWAQDFVQQFDYTEVVDKYLVAYERALAHHAKKTKHAKSKTKT